MFLPLNVRGFTSCVAVMSVYETAGFTLSAIQNSSRVTQQLDSDPHKCVLVIMWKET